MTRRLLDGVAAGVGLLLLSPVFLIIAILIKLDSPGPVFYRAERVGEGGELFHLFKFRSMVAGANRAGPGITVAGDNRITPVGRVLRNYKLDELPQLLNVLRGEMSLVGPRPEDPRYVAHYTKEQYRVLSVRPGMTGVAALAYRNEEQALDQDDWEKRYLEEIMPHKLALDLAYLRQRTFLSDLKVIWRTLWTVARGR